MEEERQGRGKGRGERQGEWEEDKVMGNLCQSMFFKRRDQVRE